MISSHLRWDLYLTFGLTVDALLVGPNVHPAVAERPVVRHVIDNFIDDDDEQLSYQNGSSDDEYNDESRTMSSFPSYFKEKDALFLEFDDTFNNKGNHPRRHQESQNLELERYVLKHDKIPITIALGAEKSISPHVVRFNNAIGYIEVVKGALQNQMLELQSQPILEGSQPLSRDEICETILEIHSREVEEVKVLIKQQRIKLEEAKRLIEEQMRTLELHAQQMEEMKKIIEEMSQA
ncbi:CACTA en-spm transposon protein [Cucumis melo var. makuwa]|uniref:CACTA en-spm transposon protein n=1 Tax=Cucumis melo var. makuwa TaxID=1194695 RepID=A0A5A7TCV1_CUCMM|nr:CACTA en-spm transposon protein [Cucumis melo var. makuwa]TYK20306.1 CACTA en-spm transposon protein [Cucumis melo var. makuwa]